MNFSKHKLLVDIVSAVPDIGDKTARELSIARTAYNAATTTETAKFRATLVALDSRLRECANIHASADDAYDSYYQELVKHALEEGGKP